MPRYDDLSREELLRLLQARDRRDATRFGLVWETNEVEREKALNADFVALDLDQSLSTAPLDPAAGWRNLIIEGDNFDALRFLRMAYAGRVKCICIDPPYNTGNRDFVYNDRFVDKEDAWRHSRWCEFMFQRLTLAKELLAEDGVIFVHIDDNEVAALRLLMQRVFGEQAFVATLIWKRRTSPDSRNLNGVSSDHEYVLCFHGGIGFRMRGRAKDLSKYSNPDNDPLGSWMSDNLTGLANAIERPNLHYDVIHPQSGLRYPPHPGRGWVYGKERMLELIQNGRILWPKAPTGRPRLKRYLTDMLSSETGFSTVLDSPGNVEATKELGKILGPKAFTFPKPKELVAQLVEQSTGPNDLVLDFFAGSGTTAHAVLKQNAADVGNRRFILVSSTEATEDEPDKNLCRDVCAERVRRVIAGYGDKPGLPGDFAYLRCRRIPEGEMLAIAHDQVWTALQLIHRETLQPYAEAALPWVEDEDGALCYVPRLDRRTAAEIKKRARGLPGVAVYTWQPGLLAPRLGGQTHIQVEAIPQSLARRFGLRKG